MIVAEYSPLVKVFKCASCTSSIGQKIVKNDHMFLNFLHFFKKKFEEETWFLNEKMSITKNAIFIAFVMHRKYYQPYNCYQLFNNYKN